MTPLFLPRLCCWKTIPRELSDFFASSSSSSSARSFFPREPSRGAASSFAQKPSSNSSSTTFFLFLFFRFPAFWWWRRRRRLFRASFKWREKGREKIRKIVSLLQRRRHRVLLSPSPACLQRLISRPPKLSALPVTPGAEICPKTTRFWCSGPRPAPPSSLNFR